MINASDAMPVSSRETNRDHLGSRTPPSLAETFVKMSMILVGIYFFLSKKIGDTGHKYHKNQYAVITDEEATFLTKLRQEEMSNRISRWETTLSAISSRHMDDYILPVFLTHDKATGEFLGNHKCAVPQNINSTVDISIYITNEEVFSRKHHEKYLFHKIEGIIFDWTYDKAPSVVLNYSSISDLIRKKDGNVFAHAIFDVAIKVGEKKIKTSLHKKVSLILKKEMQNSVEPKKLLESRNNEIVRTYDKRNASYWRPSLDLSLVLDFPSTFSRNEIPRNLAKFLNFSHDGSFAPIIYINDFWFNSDSFVEINETTKLLTLSISYKHIPFWKWHMQTSLSNQWQIDKRSKVGSTEKEIDAMKDILQNTPTWLIVVTIIVSILHMVFDTLAFSSDIRFWRTKQSLKGTSVRALSVNCFFQTVILLYLYDNETSYMILFSSALGVCIEYWKLSKVFQLNMIWVHGHAVPRVSLLRLDIDLDICTHDADVIVTSHLLHIVIPLILGYSAYSLLYIPQKSFYSWIINSLVGFVYSFGFILMVPQLYINYKLKSVAHMPWKAMVYKSLNTFIDDLFAFIIKMPLLHRLSCFRDDIIFFVFLYQRWIYRVDFSRKNEFGQFGESDKKEYDIMPKDYIVKDCKQ